MTNTENTTGQFPDNWRISSDYDPNQHLMSLKGRDYLNVQNRLLWFIRDQRDFIVRGLATTSYVIRTELIEHDRDAGYAQFKTYVRDVMGNEATMYGSEAAKDFADYAEKASTKSLGRALLALGYGTAFAPEMDEGDRVVDSPVERPQNARQRTPQPHPAAQPQHAPASTSDAPTASQRVSTQDTPAVDPLALTHASALDQKRLSGQLAARFHTATAQANFLRSVTERDIDPANVLEGRSDLTVPELARLNERLTRITANGNGGGRR